MCPCPLRAVAAWLPESATALHVTRPTEDHHPPRHPPRIEASELTKRTTLSPPQPLRPAARHAASDMLAHAAAAHAHQRPDDAYGNERAPDNPLFPSNNAPSPSPYAPPHFQGHLTLLPGLHLATPFEGHEINLLAQKILRISIAIFVWSSLNTVRCKPPLGVQSTSSQSVRGIPADSSTPPAAAH